jgi:AcrR family transcriptional regulator
MSDDPTAELPAGVRLLWGLPRGHHEGRRGGRRGPKPSLRREEIVDAAIDIADAEGLGAVSMARVAEKVGVSTMALYRYVANKDELLLLMSDAALDLPPALAPASASNGGSGRDASWREDLTAWAHAIRGVWMRRPWLLRIPVTGPPAGPNNMAWLEAGLTALAGTGLSGAARIEIVSAITTYLRGEAWLNLDLLAASANDPESFALDYGGPFARLLDPERFPELSKVVVEGPFREPDEPDELVEHHEVGLEIVLDGIARRVAAARSG